MASGAQRVLMALFGVVVSGCSVDSGTAYAPNYSEQGFISIRVGMASNEVMKILGAPLRIDHQLISQRWVYCSNRISKPIANSSLFFNAGNLSVLHVVTFDQNDVVVGYSGSSKDLTGKDRAFVSQTLGTPTTVETNLPGTILSYTLGKNSGSHHVRAVLLDENGNVACKKAFYYRD